MQRKSKTTKDANPEIYGYGTLEELLADTRFDYDPENTLTNWVPFRDADGDQRFIPCTEEYYHFHRNEERNEKRRKNTESRCMISSEKFGLVKCREDCSKCTRARTGFHISMDYMFDNYEFEFVDESYESNQEKEEKQHQSKLILSVIEKFDETDQQIIKLFSEGKTDAAIASIVKKSRSMVQERRVKLIDMLKEKLKKYEN